MRLQNMAKVLAGVTALALVALGGATSDVRADEGVKTGFLGNDPNSTSRDDTIAEHVANLILGAEKDSDITVAAHFFGDWLVRDSLQKRADDTNIRIIVDGKAGWQGDEEENYDEYAELHSELGEPWDQNPSEDPEWMMHCRFVRACIGDGKMHNKFFLFEKTRGVENVVVQTSANLKETGSGNGMWNTAYTAADAGLYKHYLAYFRDLAVVNKSDNYYYENNELPPAGGKHTVYHSPRGSGNTMIDLLDKVDCTKTNDTGGTDPGHRTIVRVAMWMISGSSWNSEGTTMARKLKHMDDQGCYVDVIADVYGKGKGAKDGSLEALLRKPKGDHHGPEVREFYGKSDKGGVHSKDILIDGHFGAKNQKVVITGTFNLTGKSVRHNDETILVIKDARTHDDFKENFFTIRKAASLTWQTSKYKR